jgi:hypothetical protein
VDLPVLKELKEPRVLPELQVLKVLLVPLALKAFKEQLVLPEHKAPLD